MRAGRSSCSTSTHDRTTPGAHHRAKRGGRICRQTGRGSSHYRRSGGGDTRRSARGRAGSAGQIRTGGDPPVCDGRQA